ncbi:MAG: tRNA (adenosine(37)-N6)-threonylcarbamoyltransferase complex transferase subunit TsaD, partial [bacterium]
MDNKEPTILAIDTSCDDTSVAITKGKSVVINCVSSQIEMHKKTGGVVPMDAARAHAIKMDPLIKYAFKRAKLDFTSINAIAVTYGPGLAPALEVGLKRAKELAVEHQIPLIAVNHMAGHIYANWAQTSTGKGGVIEEEWPTIALLISGGHTEIVLMNGHNEFSIIGETLDDACGECFDKVGRMMGLGYPAGPVIEEFAKKGNDKKYILPKP